MKKLLSLLLLSAAFGPVVAQPIHYDRFPGIESATYDNNGYDLRGFIKGNKASMDSRAAKVYEYSSNNWGYMQVKTVKVPGEDKKGRKDYYHSFNVTLALAKTNMGDKATWWTREYNQPNAPLVYAKAGDDVNLGMDNVKYADVANELQSKKFTIVEYFDTSLNTKDMDMMLGNVIYIKGGAVKQLEDYKAIIDFYNEFMGKFSAVSDPQIEDMSFITFVRSATQRYIGYFNVVNGKLSGRLEPLDIQFESDKAKFVDHMMKHVSGHDLYLYGNKTFGMEKTINKKAAVKNLKAYRKYPTMTGTFNDIK